MAKQTGLRWLTLLAGLIMFGVGLALIVRANLGLGPWDVLHQGLSRHTGVPIGTVSIPVGLLILLAWLPLGERPGWGTLLNVVMIGLVLDGVLLLLPDVANLAARAVLLVAGIVVTGAGSGLYLSAQIGAGPRDGLMLGLSRKTGWSIRTVRTLIELSALVVGWLLGGTVGIGTLAFAFGIGPIVQVALRVFERPMPVDERPMATMKMTR
ncbi:MAG TPA: hypothetical protein VFT66_07725 [Roseiflexaceae bacterium]|jgi:uncharacterized membrane protein YczE|nr:hypothetical protein [Roseiflexaceae bacterium]